MVNRKCILAGIGLVLLGMVGSGCQNQKETPQTNSAAPPIAAQQPPATDPTKAPASETPVRDALERCFASAGGKGSHSAIPAGTRLLSVNLENGVASVDVSKEFSTLANKGETSESHAQKELRALLAQFPEVHKMRLT